MSSAQDPNNEHDSSSETLQTPCPPVSPQPSSVLAEKRSGPIPGSCTSARSISDWLFYGFVAVYVCCAIFAWSIIFVLSFVPIGVQSYSVTESTYDTPNLTALYLRSGRWYQAAKVLNAGINAITIPIATAICARAAVAYTQSSARNVSLRQIMAFADSGWSNLRWSHLITFRGLRRYSSSFLWIAISLHILGLVLFPVQQIFLSQTNVQVPGLRGSLTNLFDVEDYFPYPTIEYFSATLQSQALQNLLAGMQMIDAQPNIWLNNPLIGCKSATLNSPNENTTCTVTKGLPTWQDTANNAQQPFVAFLPASFNTGLIRQFLPRLNSSLSYTAVSASEFPDNCNQIPGAYWLDYSGLQGSNVTFTLQVCIPYDVSKNVFGIARTPQHLHEVAYINASLFYPGGHFISPASIFQIEVNTSAGYFELPNFLNGNQPSSLLEVDPTTICLGDCSYQWPGTFTQPLPTGPADQPEMHLGDNLTESQASLQVEGLLNAPPLVSLMVALFGSTSYLASYSLNQQQIQFSNPTTSIYNFDYEDASVCASMAPLTLLFTSWLSGYSASSTFLIDFCAAHESGTQGQSDGDAIGFWLMKFWFPDPSSPEESVFAMQDVLSMAIYAADFLFLTKNVISTGNLKIYSDPGIALHIPTISVAGIITISLLMGVFIFCLITLVVYSAHKTVWTSTFNSFAMLRIGASVGEDKLPLLLSRNENTVDILDEIPGWIGDGDAEAEIGRFEMGAMAPLKSARKYLSYPDALEREKPTENLPKNRGHSVALPPGVCPIVSSINVGE